MTLQQKDLFTPLTAKQYDVLRWVGYYEAHRKRFAKTCRELEAKGLVKLQKPRLQRAQIMKLTKIGTAFVKAQGRW